MSSKVLFRTDSGIAISKKSFYTDHNGRRQEMNEAYFRGDGALHAKVLAKHHGPSGALGIVDVCLRTVPNDNFWQTARRTLEKMLLKTA